MVGRAGYECVALLLAGYVATRRWLNRHVGCEVSACRLRFTVSVASSTRSFTIGGHAADSGLGSHDGAPDHFAEPCTELAELRRARAAHRSVTRQHLGCLPDERLPMVSAFAVALEQWFGLWCAFVAGMSVTGDWL